jgi:hypothetical protein
MGLNFKNILTESVIDGLNLNKFDKGVLKIYNNISKEESMQKTTDDYNDAFTIVKTSEMLSYYDYDKLLKLYKFYKKYKNILFMDSPSEEDLNIKVKYPKDSRIVDNLLLKYYYDNYIDKPFEVGNFTWEFNIPMGSYEEAILEESDAIEVRLLGDETVPIVSIFVGLTENKKGIGYDMISMDDGLSEYNAKYIVKKGKYEEIIGTGYIMGLHQPKDLKESTIKNYFEELIDNIKIDIIAENQWKIEEYMEWVSENQPPR